MSGFFMHVGQLMVVVIDDAEVEWFLVFVYPVGLKGSKEKRRRRG